MINDKTGTPSANLNHNIWRFGRSMLYCQMYEHKQIPPIINAYIRRETADLVLYFFVAIIISEG